MLTWHVLAIRLLIYTTSSYSMMLWCWEMEPDKRPSFSTLVRSISISLEAMADYLCLGPRPAVTETETTESAV